MVHVTLLITKVLKGILFRFFYKIICDGIANSPVESLSSFDLFCNGKGNPPEFARINLLDIKLTLLLITTMDVTVANDK